MNYWEKNLNTILALVKCPRCLKYTKPPSVLCENGHVVCFDCREITCSICSSTNFPNNKNSLFDQLLKQLMYPCVFKIEGCIIQLKYDEISEHEAACLYQVQPCMFTSVGCQERVTLLQKTHHEKRCKFGTRCRILWIENDIVLEQCEWTGFKENLVSHISNTHKSNVSKMCETDDATCFFLHLSLGNNLERVQVITTSKHLFYLYSKVVVGVKMYLVLQLIGNKLTKSKLVYSLQFMSGTKGIEFEDSVLQENELDGDVFESSNCFEINIDVLQKNFNADDSIRCTIKIRKAQKDEEKNTT